MKAGLIGWTTVRDLVKPSSKRQFLDALGRPWDGGKILFDNHNVITTTGKTRAAQLLGGINTNKINSMAIGDGGAPGGSPSTPYIPLAADTGLADELQRTALINPVIVGSNVLKFSAIFLTSPPLSFMGALHAINEVGLFFLDDVQPGTPHMFARNTFPSIPFDPVDREGVIVTWSITIV